MNTVFVYLKYTLITRNVNPFRRVSGKLVLQKDGKKIKLLKRKRRFIVRECLLH